MSTRRFTRTIRLSHVSASIRSATLACSVSYLNEGELNQRKCRIELQWGSDTIVGEDRDFFDAFCRVREVLEPLGLTPLCYGASRNVFPSGMCRDMGDGLKAYRLTFRRSATDLVDIFAEGNDIEPVDVAKQREFWEAWLRSMGR